MKKNDHRRENAKRILKSAGYSEGGMQTDNLPHPDAAEDKALIKKMVKPKAIKAGYVNGGAPKKRLDKPSRVATPVQLARGGAAKKKGAKTQVNVIVAGKGNQPAMPMAAPMPPRPAMVPPPPPAAAMPPRPGMKRGGKVESGDKIEMGPKMKGGAGGGLGRLEKAKEYGGKPLKRGGKAKGKGGYC